MVKGTVIGLGKPNKLKALVRECRESLSDQIELYGITAKLHRAKYLALIDEGFTPEQALELSKTL